MVRNPGDKQLVADRFDSIKRYVDYMPTVTHCSNCKAPTDDTTMAPNTTDLPWFYMNGDWMEYESQALELKESGPILSSFHYVKV